MPGYQAGHFQHPKACTMNQTPPDRLSTDPKSPYCDPELLGRGIGIKLNGVEKINVDEYCVSEGWIRIAVASTRDRKGNPLTIKLKGMVEPYFKDAAASEAGE